jgi:hypothetical protein
MPTINKFVSTFFCLLLFKGCTRTSFFKDKKVLKKSQNSRNQGFSFYFCFIMKGSESGEAQPLTDPTDPDPDAELWFKKGLKTNKTVK